MNERKNVWSWNFTIITLGTVISAIGGAAMNVAMGLVVFDNTNSSMLTAVFMAVSLVPNALLPVIMGPYIDNHKKKPMIYGLDLIMGALYIAFGIHIFNKSFEYIPYMLFSIITGVLGSVYLQAYSALYPDLIPKGFMQQGYSISSMIYPTVTILMAPVGAFVYAKLGIKWIFIIEGILLIIASLFEMTIKISESYNKKQNKFSFAMYFNDIAEGFRYLKKEKGIKNLYFYMTMTNALSQGTNLMTLSYFQTSSFLSTTMYGLLTSAETFGRMLGGFVHYFAKIKDKNKFKITKTVYIIYNLFDGILLFLPFIGMLINRFVCGFLGVNSATLREAAIQQYLKPNMRARINSLLSVAITSGVIIFRLIAGFLGEFLPYRTIALIFAIIGLLSVHFIVIKNKDNIDPLFMSAKLKEAADKN